MQLQGLSLLRKQQPASSHVYYVPASGAAPTAAEHIGLAPRSADEAPVVRRGSLKDRSAKKTSSLDPLEAEVLEEMRRAVEEPGEGLVRRHTIGDVTELEEGKAPPSQDLEHRRRLAELILPGLKRELRNAPFEEKGALAKEIAELQQLLGVEDDTPTARHFVVSKKSDVEEHHSQRRMAELVLPGLKRELRNASFEERVELTRQIAEAQQLLGVEDDTPTVRPFIVGRSPNKVSELKEEEDMLPNEEEMFACLLALLSRLPAEEEEAMSAAEEALPKARSVSW